MQIILASQNKNKLKELSTVFQKKLSKHSLVFPNKVLNVIEDKETIKENAEKKASEYFKFYDLPVIADDSGLFVEALNVPLVFIQPRFQEKIQIVSYTHLAHPTIFRPFL